MANEERKSRRRLWIILGLFGAFLLYGYAVQETDVDLAEVQSETRRASLVRIMRNLAQPNLITYDSEEVTVSADVLVPCPEGASGPEADTSGALYLVVEPSCAEPGDIVTVTGVGFAADAAGQVSFRPDSEFDITRPLEGFTPDSDGNFTVDVEIPNRTSEKPQQIEATTRVQVGSWLSREVVWTDLNENGVEDAQNMPDSGTLVMQVPELLTIPGAGLALIDDDEPVQMFQIGEDFVAASGPAEGLAMSAGVVDDTTEFLITDADEAESTITLTGPGDSDLRDLQILLYDPETGNRSGTHAVADRFAHSPRLSENALETWDKIVETVFMAFLATTLGTLIALPLSFLAARNLMRDIRTTVTNLALNLLAIPIGGLIGLYLSRVARSWTDNITDDWIRLLLVILIPIGLIYALRAILKEEDTEAPTSRERAITTTVFIAAGFVVAIWGFVFAALLKSVGENAGWGFIGNFIFIIGEVTRLLLPVFAIAGAIGMMMNFGSKLGFALNDRLEGAAIRSVNLPLAAAAGAIIAMMIGAIINWFYQFDNLWTSRWIPGIVGALIGLYLAARVKKSEGVGVGMIVYYMSRTLFNTLRSIEPLVMVIVFVVWVGFGPFAGSLALSLHTAAALAKLYSEQVESVMSGPIEAIRATGATRMQTIIYGVVPQIVPPYLSFTMYRWDINVRMSTIIGFAGGGGIGFLLQQNINLLQYKDAAAQMLAIAIVVATMDWISARLRERLV
ncbi:MAG: ABC transporter permease subunit [Acidimicrobiia bacterium]|nr:ABC transporter permease subunit [Acidimicrobiia bacterium]